MSKKLPNLACDIFRVRPGRPEKEFTVLFDETGENRRRVKRCLMLILAIKKDGGTAELILRGVYRCGSIDCQIITSYREQKEYRETNAIIVLPEPTN